MDLAWAFGLMVAATFGFIGLTKLAARGTKAAAKAAATPWGVVLIVAAVTAALVVWVPSAGMVWIVVGLAVIGVVVLRSRLKAAPWRLRAQPASTSQVASRRHPDAALVDRIRAEWPQACLRSGLVAQDNDSTVAWRDANRVESSGHLLDDSVSAVTQALAKRNLKNGAGVIVNGAAVYRHPVLLGAHPGDVGPILTVEAGQFSLDDFGHRAVSLASNLRVPELNFAQSREQVDKGVLAVEVCVRDPLDGLRWSMDQRGRSGQPIVIGRSRGGDVVWDPYEAAHVGVQGVTRSGKSELVYGMLSALAERPEVLVTGVDPSRVLLSPWRDCPEVEQRSIGQDLEGAARVLDGLVAEMDTRLEQLDAEGVDKLEVFSPDRPLLVVALEEFAGLTRACSVLDRALKPAERLQPRIETAKDRLLCEGAKVGVRVMMIAQRFDASLVGGVARSQFGLRITLRMDNLDGVKMFHDGLSAEEAVEVFTYPAGRALVQAPGVGRRVMQADRTEYQTYRQRVMPVPGPAEGWSDE